MSLSRAVVSVASIFVGMSAASAQQPKAKPPPAPPLFEGIMVDAHGQTAGLFFPVLPSFGPYPYVVRQINGIWVTLEVSLSTGFINIDEFFPVALYQSTDCTGPAYMPVGRLSVPNLTGPSFGVVATIPPATAPSIYFAGTPTNDLNFQSSRVMYNAFNCGPASYQNTSAGPVQSVTVSSLGLTLPFSIK